MKIVTPIRIVLVLIGILSLANVLLLTRISNPTVGFTLQGVLSVGLIVYALLLRKLPKWVHFAMGGIAVIPLVFALFLAIYGNVSNADYTEDVVIVLGAGIHGEQVSRPLARRLDTAIDHWRRNPEVTIVVTGGLGNRAVITEAEAMARYLMARGVPEAQILREGLSTSTYENLIFAKEILDEVFPDGFSAVVITNDFHIYRAVRTARHAGLNDVRRSGAETAWYTWPTNYLREMLAVISLWVFGVR